MLALITRRAEPLYFMKLCVFNDASERAIERQEGRRPIEKIVSTTKMLTSAGGLVVGGRRNKRQETGGLKASSPTSRFELTQKRFAINAFISWAKNETIQ